MFWVDPGAGKVEEVYRQVPAHHENALFWRDDGDVLIHEPNEEVVRVHRNGQTWSQTDRIHLPHGSSDRFSSLQSNGTTVVGIHETVSEPQNLFLYETGKNAIRILTDLNPQLGTVKFAPVQTVHWTAASGVDVEGLLFMPQDYAPGKRYPLVIQTKGDQGWFTCDSGQNHDPSFAPQPIANAGMMYLARTVEPGFNYQDAEAN
jgi:dipeptidyl aminopeptidase/acylaminoacyl peptidase